MLVSLLVPLVLCGTLGSVTADHSAENTPGFASEVRPILSRQCLPCHGPDTRTRKADLRLDRREGEGPDRAEVGVQPHHVAEAGLVLQRPPQRDEARFVGEQHLDATVADLKRQPLGGRRDVEGHVSCACLQDPVHRGDALEALGHEQAHSVAPLDASPAQSPALAVRMLSLG